ncbi:hypothetical protein [Halalkalibacillus halophilus]|uniref:hypothetical protein n=1 Tax=Halalkalibacillus halophilus TaxID=392827 RepID=UPI0004019016|nr:hypothetical protein [Halalkalibacillus halophilus]
MLIKRYFMSGTTAKGYVHFYENAIEQLEKVVYLEGSYPTITSPVLQRLVNQLEDEPVEYIHHHLKPDLIEGVIFPQLNVGIFDRGKMNIGKIAYPALYEKLVYFGECYQAELIQSKESLLREHRKEVKKYYEQAIGHFKQALEVHHKVEGIYKKYLNIERANQQTEDLLKDILLDIHLFKPSEVKHRYLGAATPDGAVDYVLDLTRDIKRRVFIKGRAGTGKSTMLRKIAREAADRGLNVEIYHCGFDPTSLDMVIIREISFAIFDATAPHEHFPTKQTDEVFDVYERWVDGRPDQHHEKEILELKEQYHQEMKLAISALKAVESHQIPFEEIYQQAINYDFLEETEGEILEFLTQQKKQKKR